MGFSTVDAIAKLVNYAEKNQQWNRVTFVLAIDIKSAIDNVPKGLLLKTMSDISQKHL
jgi:retron-type reverse transcriptase